MQLSLRDAAQQAGVSKSTILRAVKAGRLSAARTDDGGYSIEPGELFRVYPAQQTQRVSNGAMGQDAPGRAPDATDAVLEAQLAGLREILRRADAAADELRQDRDKWRSMAENQQKLLADHRPRSWWRKL